MTRLARLRAWLARRRPAGQPLPAAAICIPVEGGKGAAFVLGVAWTPHLTRDSVTAQATSKARQAGYTHTWVRTRSAAETFGLARIEPADAKAHRQLISLCAAFAQSVQDRAATSLLLLDLRDAVSRKGGFFVASAARGQPQNEALVADEQEALLKLAAWAGQSRSGVAVYVDTGFEDLFESLAQTWPSATSLRLNKLGAAALRANALQPIGRPGLRRMQVAALLAVALVVFGWDMGKQAYDRHSQTLSAAQAQKVAIAQYVAARDTAFAGGYGAALNLAVDAALRELRGMPMVRNGWAFASADCDMAQSQCTLVWSRVYGTYDSFLESAVPSRVTLDAADYRSLRETRPIDMPAAAKRPAYERLPVAADFTRRNGDRADTFALAGLSEFAVTPFKPLATWGGQGVAPGPEVAGAAWKLSASPDQVVEAVANGRLPAEFGVTRLVLAMDRAQQLNLTVEGNVYVRQ